MNSEGVRPLGEKWQAGAWTTLEPTMHQESANESETTDCEPAGLEFNDEEIDVIPRNRIGLAARPGEALDLRLPISPQSVTKRPHRVGWWWIGGAVGMVVVAGVLIVVVPRWQIPHPLSELIGINVAPPAPGAAESDRRIPGQSPLGDGADGRVAVSREPETFGAGAPAPAMIGTAGRSVPAAATPRTAADGTGTGLYGELQRNADSGRLAAAATVETALYKDAVSPASAVDQARYTAVAETIRDWTAAWSAQRIDDYLAHYSDRFTPADGSELGDWREQRILRLTRPAFISVEMSEPAIEVLTDTRVRATFRQTYASDTYTDRVTKILEFEATDGRWQIVAERATPR